LWARMFAMSGGAVEKFTGDPPGVPGVMSRRGT
jgi:hypothetical protein